MSATDVSASHPAAGTAAQISATHRQHWSRPTSAFARAGGYLVLLFVGLGTVFPFVWMLLTSVRESNTVFSGGFLPSSVSFAAYRSAWVQVDMAHHFFVSVWMTVVTVIGVVSLSTLSGYAFAKLRFPGKQAIYLLLLSTLMVPPTATIIPLFIELRDLHLINNQGGLVLVYIGTALPFSMFLMRAFFESLPSELIEAGKLDGATQWSIFRRIMLPLAAPGVATVVIFQFLQTWNEFLMANTLLQSPNLLPLQPMLFALNGQYSTNWPVLTAALTITSVPVIIVYVRMQRQFVAGLTLGAIK